jgi:hypothetical protein
LYRATRNASQAGRRALRSRNIAFESLWSLAGVLLGKASANSLYGQQDGQPQSVPQFW